MQIYNNLEPCIQYALCDYFCAIAGYHKVSHPQPFGKSLVDELTERWHQYIKNLHS